MKIIILILFIFLSSSCITVTSNDFKNKNSLLSENITFDEYKFKLEEYAKNNPYPKIDE